MHGTGASQQPEDLRHVASRHQPDRAGGPSLRSRRVCCTTAILTRLLKAEVAEHEINEATVRQLHRCEVIDASENIVPIGSPDT